MGSFRCRQELPQGVGIICPQFRQMTHPTKTCVTMNICIYIYVYADTALAVERVGHPKQNPVPTQSCTADSTQHNSTQHTTIQPTQLKIPDRHMYPTIEPARSAQPHVYTPAAHMLRPACTSDCRISRAVKMQQHNTPPTQHTTHNKQHTTHNTQHTSHKTQNTTHNVTHAHLMRPQDSCD